MEKQIIDIGVNLLHKQYDMDREEIIKKAENANITPLIITGTNVRESQKAAAYAGNHIGKLYSTAGVHPHDAKSCDSDTIKKLRIEAQKPQVVAIGECGLDYDRNFSPQDVQRKWFEEQIKLAEELNMPLFLHERSAFADFKEILSAHKEVCSRSVVHCFTGTGKELQTYLSMGCFIGITGWVCDERRGQGLRTLIRMIPANKLMIETDAPFLYPRNMSGAKKGSRNEPAFLRHILKDIASCIGKKPDELAELTTENAKRFFGLP